MAPLRPLFGSGGAARFAVRLLGLALTLVLCPAASLTAQQATVEHWTLSSGGQRCVVARETRVVQGRTYRALRLVSLGGATGHAIDLSESPLWRVDLRRLDSLGPTALAAPVMRLLPSLDPAENPLQDTVLWVDVTGGAEARVHRIGERLILEWDDFDLASISPWMTGTLDVRVVLDFPAPDADLRAGISVVLRRDGAGQANHALLSVCFPELLLGALEFDAEPPPAAMHRDDLLLSCFQQGTLWMDPVQLGLADLGTGAWGPDSRHLDFTDHAAMQFGFPGETAAQFLYYYDLADAEAAEEPWIYRSGNWLAGWGRRPSLRGGGTGLYLAAQDPDANIKRFVTEVAPDAGGADRLRLAVRTWLEFREDRIDSLVAPGAAAERLQTYEQGDWAGITAGGLPEDLDYEWSVALSVLRGDWMDAATHYRDWFHAESAVIERDAHGAAVPVRATALIPQLYRDLIAVVGLCEALPWGVTAPFPVTTGQLTQVRAYFDFLREEAPRFQDPAVDLPWYAVLHGEGMYDAATQREPFKSAGNDLRNFDARQGLPALFAKLRMPEPASGWIGHVVAAVNRDSGTLLAQVGPGDPRLMRREDSSPAVRSWSGGLIDKYLDSYASAVTADALAALVELSRSQIRWAGRSQTDWIWLSGQSSVAKPDYTRWDPARRTGQLLGGVGGGASWARNLQLLRERLQQGTSASSRVETYGSERISEAFLQRNIPSGHRQPVPITARDRGGLPSLHPLLYAEPVPVTSVLFHDVALMRGSLESFSLYYGTPQDRGTVHEVPVEALFDQTDPVDRRAGTVLAMRRIAQQLFSDGVIPFVAVGVDGGVAFERAAGAPNLLDHADDRLTTSFSGLVTVGSDDAASGRFGADDPAWTLRELLRVRSRLRAFLNGGRRVRDPLLLRPAGEHDWFHDRLRVRRWAAADLSSGPWTIQEFHGGLAGSASPAGGLSLEKLIVGAWVDDAPAVGESGAVRAAVIAFNACAETALRYQLELHPESWGLPAGEDYVLRAVDARLVPAQGYNAGRTVLAAQRRAGVRLPEAVPGEAPHLDPWGVQVWILEIQ